MADYVVATRGDFAGKVPSVLRVISTMNDLSVRREVSPDIVMVDISHDDVHLLRMRIGSGYAVEPASFYRQAA